MTEGIRKEKNLPERIARSLIQNEELFIQSLKIFANTSIVGSQGAQSGGSSGGPSGVGNYLRKDGDIMDGVFATRPSIANIVSGEVDIRKVTADNYTSKIFVIAEGGADDDEINYILGGAAGTSVIGAEFPGQWLIIQPIAGQTITINNDASGGGDPTASPRQNIRTPDGNPVVLQNEISLLLNFDITSGQWNFLGAIGGSALSGAPACFTERDLGSVFGSQTIVFNANAYARMIVTGSTTITFDTDALLIGKWYQLTVEILQDPGGGNNVTFSDAPFENQVTPVVYTAGNRYTTIRFYAYRIGTATVRIFAFEENQPFPTQFFDGYIQARLDTNQTSNLTPNKHIEFDLKLATDNTITVSVGGGQAAGIFSKFEVGHLYQCECHYAIEGVIASSELTVQFFNVSKTSFFGSQGRAMNTTHALLDSSQPVAKGFFVADSIGEQIEVRIRSASGVDKIIAGAGSGESTSYVVIKDCGVAGIESLEGNLVDAPAPSTADKFGPFEGYSTVWASNSTTNFDIWIFSGHDSSFGERANVGAAMSSGTMRRMINRIIVNGGGRADFWARKNLADVGSIIGIANGGIGISFIEDIDVPFVKDDILGYRWRRNNSNGTLQINTFHEVQYNEDDKVQHWYSDFERKGGTLGFWSPRNGGKSNVGGNLEKDFQVEMPIPGDVRDMNYYGTSPTGSDNTPEMGIRVNGIPIVTRTLATGGGVFLQRFTGTSANFARLDLVGCTGIGADAGVGLEGIMGLKIDF